MKKLILCSLVTISVAFGVDCNAMIERYRNEPTKLFYDCVDNDNADACLCSSAVIAISADKFREDGDYKKAEEMVKNTILFSRKACQLGSREACALLDKAGMER